MITGKDILFRSHNFHELCTGTRTDKDGFGDTAKAHVMRVFREVVRGTYTKKIDTMQMTKGTAQEMHGIQRSARVNGWGIVTRYNKQINDHIGEGTPDVYLNCKPLGFDQKCCFTDEQFFKVFMMDELDDKANIIQAKRYAMMTEIDKWYVCKSLENSPESVVVSHAWKLWKDAQGDGPVTEEFIDDVRALHVFDHLPDWARVKTFEIPFTNEDAVYFEKRAEKGREHFDYLLDKYYSQERKQF